MQNQDSPAPNKPLISICIANYNGIDIIGPCIDSAQNQQTNYEFEILVHDDASTDNSCDFIEQNYPNVKLVKSITNVGYCISNNTLVEHSRGKYLLFLNNDATLFSNAIQTLADYAETSSSSCLLGLPQYDLENSQLIDRGALFDLFLNPVANRNSERTKVGMTIGACLWIPKSIWNEIGGFPTWFGSLAEDMYLCMNAIIRGYDICVLPDSGYFHMVGRSFGGGKLKNNRMVTTYKRRQLSERNKCYVMILFYPRLLLYILLPIHLIVLIIEGSLLSVIKLDFNILRCIYINAFTSMWKMKKFLVKQRKELQSCRKINLRKFLSFFVYYPYKLKMLFVHGIPSIK